MKLYELIELMDDSQRVEILDGDGRLAGEYNGKDSIDSELDDCDVYRIIARDNTIRFIAEIPTKTVSFSARVSYKGGARFISCGHEYRNGGSGSPCDSLEQAIDFFNRELRKEVN